MHMYAFLWVLASIFIPPKLSDYKYQQIGLKNEYFLSQPFNVNKDARGGGSYHDNLNSYSSHLGTAFSQRNCHYWPKFAVVSLHLHILTQNFVKFHFFIREDVLLSHFPKDQYAPRALSHSEIPLDEMSQHPIGEIALFSKSKRLEWMPTNSTNLNKAQAQLSWIRDNEST